MDITLTPDNVIYAQWGFVNLNATIVFTWVVMAILVGGSWLITRNMSTQQPISRWQSLLETLVLTIRDQIAEVSDQKATPYLPFIGTLFLFISLSNLLSVVPGYRPPTSSLSATGALALLALLAVPVYAIRNRGVTGYLKYYIEPTPIMLPFKVLSEITRTLALAVRLFGNIMSGTLILTILMGILPLFVPILLEGFELLIGQIQAYIFAILAMVYITSAARSQEADRNDDTDNAAASA